MFCCHCPELVSQVILFTSEHFNYRILESFMTAFYTVREVVFVWYLREENNFAFQCPCLDSICHKFVIASDSTQGRVVEFVLSK